MYSIQTMKADDSAASTQEIELKLALPTSDPLGLSRRLARTSLLARRKATRTRLHNVYYDTPEQILREQQVALRIRRKGNSAKPQWLQTLKTGGHGGSALSTRGEWESTVPGAALDKHVLRTTTPWARIDPDGSVFSALRPRFETDFERTSWSVRRRDGSVVEVALDIGHVNAGGKSAPICELELELLSGQPHALFEIAQQIARVIAVLPLGLSKSERGYALARNALDTPVQASPPALAPHLPLAEAAGLVLGEMFHQFTANLNAMRVSDEPEVVHQARVGWRRFRSAWRLFKSSLGGAEPPDWQVLKPLMTFVGELRNLDVASTETLPPLAQAFAEGEISRIQAWEAMTQALLYAGGLLRKSVRYALEDPAVGANLLATMQWIEALQAPPATDRALVKPEPALREWARRRIGRLNDRLGLALKQADSPQSQHRARILSKRLRYNIEALRTLLPKKHTRHRYKRALRLQDGIGAARDLMLASVLASKVEADRGLVEFLRGVALGRAQRKDS